LKTEEESNGDEEEGLGDPKHFIAGISAGIVKAPPIA